ncbi:uncharacterized protein [Littorina saxatilis]|uniref:uncharacterized protein n=1 Tax=Littorina saxatilis TaxID=31220 RepID=UPI0038B5B435
MEFRTVFVLCLVLVPYAGGLDLPGSLDNVTHFDNQASDDMQSNVANIANIADRLKEFASDLSTEEQNRLANTLSNKDFWLESAKLVQQYAGNTDSEEYEQAQEDLFNRYL